MGVITPGLGGGGAGISTGLMVNQLFHRITSTTTTIINPVFPGVGATTINVADTTGFAIGDEISINDIVFSKYFPTVENFGPTVFSIRHPMDEVLLLGQNITKIVSDISSLEGFGLTTPVIYKVQPPPSEKWRISQLLLTMTYGSEGFDGDFGNKNVLDFGMTLRFSVGGVIRTLTEWRVNTNIERDAFDFRYSNKRGALGAAFGLNAKIDLAQLGANSVLNGASGDFIEIVNADDLLSLIVFRIMAQGHIVT